jgi:anti-sigma factor RsiW
MTDDDVELVALIDNELDESRRTALLARLAADEQLRQRYDELRDAGAPIAGSLDTLLGQAPLARLRAMLPPDDLVRQPQRRFGGIALRELAAGVVIGLLAAGAAAWVALSSGLLNEEGDWRSAVLEYMALYTNESFASLNPDPSLQALELKTLSGQVGVELTPDKVALPGLRFTTSFILAYNGKPLGEIAYVDPKGMPVLFCIIANGAANAPTRTEKRREFSLTDWSRGGHGFLVIGRKPSEQTTEWAQTLEKRI